jgi:hypothetical protein
LTSSGLEVVLCNQCRVKASNRRQSWPIW